MDKKQQVAELHTKFTARALEIFQAKFSGIRDPGGMIKMNFIARWCSRQVYNTLYANSAKPHQGSQECERRRRQIAKGQLKI